MADIVYRNEGVNPLSRRTDWGSIWLGVFVFTAIWSVFGALGVAIFASSANPNVGAPIAAMGIGMSIWAIVLTIIAMYVAGFVTGRLAGLSSRYDGLIHGMTMFGLSVVAVIVLVVLAGTSLTGGTGVVAGSAHSLSTLRGFADLGWAGFVCLFLGWLGAMAGGYSGAERKFERSVREIRPAA